MININNNAPTGATHRYEHGGLISWYREVDGKLFVWRDGSWCGAAFITIQNLMENCMLGRVICLTMDKAEPVTVTNETVRLEQPWVIAGTGSGRATESAFLIGRVIDLLRTSVDHFSAGELTDLNELTSAELTKHDERVCGGQKYIDAHWFERGELPPVGAKCEWKGIQGGWWVDCQVVAVSELEMVVLNDAGGKYRPGKMEVFQLSPLQVEFRPIHPERDDLEGIIKKNRHSLRSDTEIADAILAAGFKRGGEA